MQQYLDASLAPSTLNTYSSGEKQFKKFCQLFQIPSFQSQFPTPEEILIYFAVHLAKTAKVGTIKTYLAAVRNLNTKNGAKLELNLFIKLQYVIRGIKRIQGVHKRPRLPITLHHLKLFKFCLPPSSVNNIMLWAAMSVAFFGFLRIGEITCNSVFSSQYHLTWEDVCFTPKYSPTVVSLNLKASKTDPFRSGVTVTIGKCNSDLCPVSALFKYYQVTSPHNTKGPLFRFENGKYLSRTAFTLEIRSLLSMAGLSSSSYAGHSFRIGAATRAAEINLPQWLIKALGRWTSDCYERYIQTPTAALAQVSNSLASQ